MPFACYELVTNVNASTQNKHSKYFRLDELPEARHVYFYRDSLSLDSYSIETNSNCARMLGIHYPSRKYVLYSARMKLDVFCSNS